MQLQICGIIEQAIETYNVILKDEETKGQAEEILKQKKEELMEIADVIMPGNTFFKKIQSTDETSMIKEIAKVQVKLDMYAYKHYKKEVEEIRRKVEELNNREKTEENKQDLLDEIKILEIKYKLFKERIEEKDIEELYRVKFDILVSDITTMEESPFKDITPNSQEQKYYRKIIEERLEEIIKGTNPELIRIFGKENLPKAINYIKKVLKDEEKTFNIEKIMQDKQLLNLILLFDKKVGLKLNKKEIAKDEYDSRIKWAESIPIETIIKLLGTNQEYEMYRDSITFDSGNKFIKLLKYAKDEDKEDEKEEKSSHKICRILEGVSRFGYENGCCPWWTRYRNPQYYDRIIFPSTMKSIYMDTIYGHVKIIELNEGLKKIGERAFAETVIKEVEIPSTVEKIGRAAFWFCKKLKKVRLNEGLKEIGECAFKESGLEEIEIPSTVENIGSEAFAYCKELKKVILNEGLKQIGECAFAKSGLEEIEIPSTVENIGVRAFMHGEELKKVKLNEGVKKIAYQAFAYSGLEEIEIPSTLETIGKDAFCCCEKLKSVKLNEGLKEIGESAFSDSGLKEINIPSTIEYMPWNVFDYCWHLTGVKIEQIYDEYHKYLEARRHGKDSK